MMSALLERHWPKLALLLTLALFAGLLFAPALAQGFATPFILLTLGMGILLLALRHWRAYRAGKLSRLELARNVFVETASLLLALRHWRAYRVGKLSRRELARNVFVETASLLLAACALWVVVLARFVGGHVAEFVGAGYGWLLALLSALVVGAVAGLAVKKTLGRWVKGGLS